jgi:hypothetical protein
MAATEPSMGPITPEILKASLNEIPFAQRNGAMWQSRIKVFIAEHGFAAVDPLIAQGYFLEWMKGS